MIQNCVVLKGSHLWQGCWHHKIRYDVFHLHILCVGLRDAILKWDREIFGLKGKGQWCRVAGKCRENQVEQAEEAKKWIM